MRISELSPDVRASVSSGGGGGDQRHLLEEIESVVREVERASSPEDLPSNGLSDKLRKSLSGLKSSASPLPEPLKLQIWKLSYRLWNACVDLSNAAGLRRRGGEEEQEEQARLRQVAADLLLLAGKPAGVPSPAFKAASFFYKTGQIWHDLKRFDLASACFEKATDLTSDAVIDGDDERRLVLDLNLARSRAAWGVSEQDLALNLLNRSKSLIAGSPEAYRAVAEQYLQFGRQNLTKDPKSSEASSKLLSDALNLSEKGLATAAAGEETLISSLEVLRGKSLRFLAAARLQTEDFEGAMKCVRVLRNGGGGTCGRDHPSVAYVAMKAWLGMGKAAEAEAELRGMVVDRGVPEGVCVSAAEAYVQEVGAEAARGALAALLRRCRLGAVAALRVVQRVAGGGGGGVRSRVAAELASDEAVVAIFEAAPKERQAMHALLWNCLREYGTSADVFEKSMLYIPCDAEYRTHRAKCFRVLCLCHVALSQVDRAFEYICEAEKLEPNIASAFLKFKVYLLKKDDNGATDQIQSMLSCVDFKPEFLTLSAHEAVSNQNLPVAVASLSTLLSLYSSLDKQPTRTTEAIVIRNIVSLLDRQSISTTTTPEILKLMKRARVRMSDIGTDGFFGTGVAKREVRWFAGNAWNMGIKTADCGDYESGAEFFELASEFCFGTDDDEEEKCAMACKSIILSIAARFEGEKKKKEDLPDSVLKRAAEMLNQAQTVLSSTELPPSFAFLHILNAYQLHGRLDSDPRPKQVQLIKNFASSKASSPHYLLQLGLTASVRSQPNPEAAELALNECLSGHLASPFPDYKTIGLVIRRLIGLAGWSRKEGRDDEVYGIYTRAYRIIVGLKAGEYPADEGKWLATTAWNCSGPQVRMGRVGAAERWMKMGLDIARHVKGMDGYIECMEETLSGLRNIGGGGDGEVDMGCGVTRPQTPIAL
ncbi:hypothetical protein QJS04_geneDACA006136 [Acorus gramineus]|uniref:Protein ZIP4 homolog n=1 Tax=Acorus gramineus TaxID=55184 RepID=A0AAV9B1R9_ACOGR|nr:hypothetical protein QJS04_geneDACA006136 [Acorus gramineus]